MTLLRSASLAAALVVASSVASAAVIVIDPMTLEFPPNPCFPVTNPRVIAWGTYCDAPSCPPGVPVPAPDPCEVAMQSGFLAPLGGTSRFSAVGGSAAASYAHVVPGGTRMECVTEGGEYSAIYVAYGDHDSYQWSTDLLAIGVQAVRAVVSGDVTPAKPLYLEVMLSTGDVNTLHSSNSVLQIDAPGTYDFPIASFQGWPAGSPAADLHDVNLIDFLLSDCYDQGCVGSGFPARSYSLGALSILTDATTKSQRTSWGKLKQIYR